MHCSTQASLSFTVSRSLLKLRSIQPSHPLSPPCHRDSIFSPEGLESAGPWSERLPFAGQCAFADLLSMVCIPPSQTVSFWRQVSVLLAAGGLPTRRSHDEVSEAVSGQDPLGGEISASLCLVVEGWHRPLGPRILGVGVRRVLGGCF